MRPRRGHVTLPRSPEVSQVAATFGIIAATAFGASVYGPLLVPIPAEFDVNFATLSVLVAVPSLSRVPATPAAGYFTDRVGPRRLPAIASLAFSLGGLAATTREVIDLLDAFGFPNIMIETVGVGQTQLEIQAAADTTAVVLVPESGDGIQAMKAGLMEIADVFVVNKSDRVGADRLVREIRQALPTARKVGRRRSQLPEYRGSGQVHHPFAIDVIGHERHGLRFEGKCLLGLGPGCHRISGRVQGGRAHPIEAASMARRSHAAQRVTRPHGMMRSIDPTDKTRQVKWHQA